MHPQKKSVETTLSAIQTGKDENLPPLMNPAMLEASDDLTNLSHLNEPAGTHTTAPRDAAAAY
jgi:myosin-5